MKVKGSCSPPAGSQVKGLWLATYGVLASSKVKGLWLATYGVLASSCSPLVGGSHCKGSPTTPAYGGVWEVRPLSSPTIAPAFGGALVWWVRARP